MRSIRNKAGKIIFIFTFCCFCLIYVKVPALTPPQQIIVDVTNVITNVSHNPIGINLNFLLDRGAVFTALKELNLGSLRYPIGEIADYYLFDRNNPTQPQISVQDPNLWFSQFTNVDGTWKNPLDFDEFVSICSSLNAEPFITIGIDAIAYTGSSPHKTSEEVLQAAIDWVKYANIVKDYGIKYWEIGNENDLSDDHVIWTTEEYANTVVKFSQAMKKVDPSIKIGVNGMTGSTWWDKIMPIVKDDVDFLVTHQYSPIQSYEHWKSNSWNYTSNIEKAKLAIETYNPTLKINVTENSSFNPSTSHANNIWKMLHNFEMLGNTLCFHEVDYFHFWISRWLEKNSYLNDFSAFDSDYKLTPMGYSLYVWGKFIRKQMVYTSKSDNIHSWASFDRERQLLSLFLLNKNQKTQQVEVNFDHYDCNLNSERWVLRGLDPGSTKVIWQQFNPIKVKQSKIATRLEPLSINVLTFKSSQIPINNN